MQIVRASSWSVVKTLAKGRLAAEFLLLQGGLYGWLLFHQPMSRQHEKVLCYACRDLKLDNTLLDRSNPPVIKICDFGFAKHFASPLEKTKSHLGFALSSFVYFWHQLAILSQYYILGQALICKSELQLDSNTLE